MTEKADKSRQEPKEGAAENKRKKSGVRLFFNISVFLPKSGGV